MTADDHPMRQFGKDVEANNSTAGSSTQISVREDTLRLDRIELENKRMAEEIEQMVQTTTIAQREIYKNWKSDLEEVNAFDLNMEMIYIDLLKNLHD